jgi:hypothetical protein
MRSEFPPPRNGTIQLPAEYNQQGVSSALKANFATAVFMLLALIFQIIFYAFLEDNAFKQYRNYFIAIPGLVVSAMIVGEYSWLLSSGGGGLLNKDVVTLSALGQT